jgi:uncharacterized flavoprotein (TIGR03862 family)
MAIIGGGPAGLIAAEILAMAGHQVTVYDRMPSLARKFLMAGRGGLNLTHSEPLDKFMARYGSASEWLAPFLTAYPPEALRTWCEALGEETFVGSSGRVFPRSMKAAPLLRAWLLRLNRLGVRYATRHVWLGWEDRDLVFLNETGERIYVMPDATLLALGGASWPRLGSDGAWVPLLQEIGVDLAPLRPANMGFVVPWSEYFSSRFAGVPLKPVAITHQGVSRQGEVMVTAQGLEGGAIYALSARMREAIAQDGHTDITLDLRPDMTLDALSRKLDKARGNKSLSTYLKSVGFPPLAMGLLREAFSQQALATMPASELARLLKSLPVHFTATAGMVRAISSAGGIARHALTPDLMLRAKPGVFAAGEMLDWEAPTGGYLLQACFSTAVAAAHGMQRFVESS